MQANAKYYGPQLKKWKINALNTLTSTANNSASTSDSKKLRTYSESSRSSLYFIFSDFKDQTSGTGWKWRFSTDPVIADEASENVLLCIFQCRQMYAQPNYNPPPLPLIFK